MKLLFFVHWKAEWKCDKGEDMAVETSVFGKTPDGQDIMLYTLTNSNGMKVSVTNLGAVLVKCEVPDKEGKIEDVKTVAGILMYSQMKR